jgi:hypothetical protein
VNNGAEMVILDTLMRAWERSTDEREQAFEGRKGAIDMRVKLSVVFSVMSITAVTTGMTAGQAVASPLPHVGGGASWVLSGTPFKAPAQPPPTIYGPKWSGNRMRGHVHHL